LTPAAPITTGNRIVVLAGAWALGNPSVSGVTDAAGNTYTRVANVTASDGTQLTVWTAPVTAGGGTRPNVTVTASKSADIGAAVVEYSGLSTAAGAAAVDKLVTATATTTAAGRVTSGPTAATTADRQLAVGFYVDSGFGATLVPDADYAARVNVSPSSTMEFVVEDQVVAAGATPSAGVRTGANVPWLMSTVVFKGAG